MPDVLVLVVVVVGYVFGLGALLLAMWLGWLRFDAWLHRRSSRGGDVVFLPSASERTRRR